MSVDLKMSNKIKQVIVMRTQFPDGKGGATGTRKGKMIAQGSHASMAFLTRRIQKVADGCGPLESDDIWEQLEITHVMKKWLSDSFAKICVKVGSEEELMEIHDKAIEAGLEVHLVEDQGRTEFHGVLTKTCLAIGPDHSDKIDQITCHLKIL